MQAVTHLLIRSSQRRAVLGGLRDGASQPVAAGTPAASLHPPRRVRPLGLQGECPGRCVEGRAMMAGAFTSTVPREQLQCAASPALRARCQARFARGAPGSRGCGDEGISGSLGSLGVV